MCKRVIFWNVPNVLLFGNKKLISFFFILIISDVQSKVVLNFGYFLDLISFESLTS